MFFTSILLIVVSVAMPVIIHLCANGRIRMNSIAGIRTRQVMANSATWRAGHRAAIVPSWIGAGVAVVLELVSLMPTLSIAMQAGFVLAAALALFCGLAVGAFLANRAALNEIAIESDHDTSHSEAG